MDFNDVKKVVSDTAQKVVQKSGEAVEFGKIKYKIYDLQNENNKLFTQIGQDVYESYKCDVSAADIADKCDIIDEKKAEIEDLQAKLVELKNSKKCLGCDKMAKKEDAFCPSCGKSF